MEEESETLLSDLWQPREKADELGAIWALCVSWGPLAFSSSVPAVQIWTKYYLKH